MGATPQDQTAHVVLVPYPAQGHIPPMIHLARKLAANEIIVTLVNVDSVHKMLLKQWSCPPGSDIRLEQVECGLKLPAGVDASCLENPEALFDAVDSLKAPVEELVRELTPTPCCIIADFFLGWPLELARTLGTGCAIYWPGNAAWSSLHHHMKLLEAHGDLFCQGKPKFLSVVVNQVCEIHAGEREEDRIITYIPGVPGLEYGDLPEYFKRKLGTPSRRLLFDYDQDRMKHCEWILVNSMAELEPETFHAMQAALPASKFAAIGPLFPVSHHESPAALKGVSLRDEEDGCLKWLDTRAESSVLYVSFGSISVLSEDTFQEIAAGLEASEQAFLWVNREDLVKRSATHDEFYAGFLERTREQGMVVSWAPQVRVLAHSSIGGFLSHCGWNSTLESICYGVPLLGWPCHSEQRTNAKLVEEDWRVGKRLWRRGDGGTVTRGVVEQRITEFMSGMDKEEIWARAKDLKNVARATANPGGNSHENLAAFARAVKTMTMGD
ncbi:UDP-glycosyltransferase 86A2 [Selaginella moellendorffii]|uniref:UDP-glycosyltransferase 86A2 n=1 Tax=Selaginella moellendorffii TaxID=88036 RepID=UPI000D1C3EE4|nr:UDP-glycosyltransferase 86A2 [Selaginella moellendorffii]|eukprot:XP_024521123.1 UDP-glycosyltransferase 86A2 [Selaginella moellendorffii]